MLLWFRCMPLEAMTWDEGDAEDEGTMSKASVKDGCFYCPTCNSVAFPNAEGPA